MELFMGIGWIFCKYALFAGVTYLIMLYYTRSQLDSTRLKRLVRHTVSDELTVILLSIWAGAGVIELIDFLYKYFS